MGRRLLWSLLPAPMVVLGWLVFLGWRPEKWQNADGSLGGSYRPWQVVAFIALICAVAWISARRGSAVAAVAATTLAVTGVCIADWSGTDDSGLWAVGALLVFVGTLVGTGVIGVIAQARTRSTARAQPSPR
jgi:hypothetical protein